MSQRKIIHIDMDAFYASVEQRDRPEYRGRPIAVGYDGPRGVVATASYEARPYGVHSALSSVLAKRLCPELIFVPARFDVYKAVSRQIRAIFGEYTELVEPLSLDEAFLDVSHVRSATLVAREIKARILAETGLTASAGISVNKMLAKIASDYRKPDGLFTIPPGRIEEFVAGLPVERFFGIGEVTAEKVRILQEADKIFIDGLKEYVREPTCGSGTKRHSCSSSGRPDTAITAMPGASTNGRSRRTGSASRSEPKRPLPKTRTTGNGCGSNCRPCARRSGTG